MDKRKERLKDCIRWIPIFIIVILFSIPAAASQRTPEEWVVHYTQKIKKKPDEYRYYLGRGNFYFQLKNYTAAEKDSSAAIKLNSRSAGVLTLRGKVLYKRKKYPQALNNLNKAIGISQKNSETYYYRSLTLNALGKKKAADKDMKKAAAMGFPPAKKAIAAVKPLKPVKPNHPIKPVKPTHTVHGQNKTPQYWVAFYTKKIQSNPKNFNYYLLRGENYIKLKKYQQAETDSVTAVKLRPDSAEALTFRAEVLYKRKKLKPAMNNVNRALKIDPGNTEAVRLKKEISKN